MGGHARSWVYQYVWDLHTVPVTAAEAAAAATAKAQQSVETFPVTPSGFFRIEVPLREVDGQFEIEIPQNKTDTGMVNAAIKTARSGSGASAGDNCAGPAKLDVSGSHGNPSSQRAPASAPAVPAPALATATATATARDPKQTFRRKSMTRRCCTFGKVLTHFHMTMTLSHTGKHVEIPVTTVLLRPYTGRRHQLRVHMQSIGHPMVGDPTYTTGLVPVSTSNSSTTPTPTTTATATTKTLTSSSATALDQNPHEPTVPAPTVKVSQLNRKTRLLLHARRLVMPLNTTRPAFFDTPLDLTAKAPSEFRIDL